MEQGRDNRGRGQGPAENRAWERGQDITDSKPPPFFTLHAHSRRASLWSEKSRPELGLPLALQENQFHTKISESQVSRSNPTQSYYRKKENQEQNNIIDNESTPERHVHRSHRKLTFHFKMS